MPDPNDYFQFNITHPEPKPPRLGRANLFWSTDADSLVIQLPGMSPATIGDGLPSQSGNSGKYLTTNGTAASWASPVVSGDIVVDSIVSEIEAQFKYSVVFDDCTFGFLGAAKANLFSYLGINTEVAIAAEEIDWSLATQFRKSVSGSGPVFTFSNMMDGKTIRVIVSTSGSETTSWPAGILWKGGILPTRTVGGVDIYRFTRSNGVTYGTSEADYKLP